MLAAINDDRVEHLIDDRRCGTSGDWARGGSLLAATEAGEVMVAESRLTERIVERCLRTSTRIAPLDAIAAASRAKAGGIAALLRW